MHYVELCNICVLIQVPADKDVKLKKGFVHFHLFFFWRKASLAQTSDPRLWMCRRSILRYSTRFAHRQRRVILPQNPAVKSSMSTHWCRGEHSVGLCNPYAKLKGETCRPSRRADQPSIQLCYLSCLSSWLIFRQFLRFPFMQLMLRPGCQSIASSSAPTHVPSCYSTWSCNLLFPSLCCSPPITKTKNLGLFGVGFF